MRLQPEVFATSPYAHDFDPNPFIKQIGAAEAALGPLAAASRLLKRDISWGRFGPEDLSRIHEITRRLAVRANGLSYYFKIIDPVLGKQVGGFSVMNTPLATPTQSRTPVQTQPPSPSASMVDVRNSTPPSSLASTTAHRRPRHNRMHSASHNLYQHILNFAHNHNISSKHHRQRSSSLFHEILNRAPENPVGIFESTRYLNLESRLSHPNAEELIPRIVNDLAESSRELIATNAESLEFIQGWLGRVNENRFWKLYRRKRSSTWEEALIANREIRDKLQRELADFREKKRFVLYLSYFALHANTLTLAIAS